VSGRTLRGFSAQIPLLCPTPGIVSQFTTQIARVEMSLGACAGSLAISARAR
jgi:hypothetical protein